MVMPLRLRLAQDREQALGLALVQRRVRLVEDQQPRLFEEHAAELDQLPLADRKPADRCVHIDMQAEAREHVAARFLHGAGRDEAMPRPARD